MAATEHAGVSRLRQALQNNLKTVCSGVCSVPNEKTVLFYGKDRESACRIDLANASLSDLEHLSSACDRATFGRGEKDVLDESYRKAGKLNLEHFSSTFDLFESRIMDVVHPFILQGDNQQVVVVRPELYKLNVYDKGAFFRAHKDTPRKENMVASLVIVFATPHEGGALVLRHNDKEWVYDSGVELSSKDDGTSYKVGYVAFFSDVEHEVLPVISGYRVTLTYNIYIENLCSRKVTTQPIPRGPILETRTQVQIALADLLLDPTFLPKGGLIGFGFCHQYPFHYSASKDIQSILNILKGNDRTIYNLCLDLGLEPFIRAVYSVDGDATLMTDHLIKAQESLKNESHHFIIDELSSKKGCVFISPGSWGGTSIEHEVTWITEMTTFDTTEFAYYAYGNEPSVALAYGKFCLILPLGPFGDRTNDRVPFAFLDCQIFS